MNAHAKQAQAASHPRWTLALSAGALLLVALAASAGTSLLARSMETESPGRIVAMIALPVLVTGALGACAILYAFRFITSLHSAKGFSQSAMGSTWTPSPWLKAGIVISIATFVAVPFGVALDAVLLSPTVEVRVVSLLLLMGQLLFLVVVRSHLAAIFSSGDRGVGLPALPESTVAQLPIIGGIMLASLLGVAVWAVLGVLNALPVPTPYGSGSRMSVMIHWGMRAVLGLAGACASIAWFVVAARARGSAAGPEDRVTEGRGTGAMPRDRS